MDSDIDPSASCNGACDHLYVQGGEQDSQFSIVLEEDQGDGVDDEDED